MPDHLITRAHRNLIVARRLTLNCPTRFTG